MSARFRCPLLAALAALASCRDAAPPPAAPASFPAPPFVSGAVQLEPLPARPPLAGPRLESVDAAAAGIGFRHPWAPDARRAADFGGAFSGGGVAVGDMDGDGRPDLLLTGPSDGPRLYRNLGDFRFEDVTLAAGLTPEGWTTGAAFVDLDGDGNRDLFVGHYDEPNRVYLNDGRGHFTHPADDLGLGATLATVSPAFADCDADGDLDVFILTNRAMAAGKVSGQIRLEGGRPVVPEAVRDQVSAFVRPDGQLVTANAGQRDRLFRNDGGHFVDVTESSGLEGHEMGLGARFWDAEGDGLPDLYVSNDFFGADRLYLNTGGCRFRDAAPMILPSTPWFSMGVDVGDLNGDGRLDLFATDMAGMDHRQRVASMGDLVDDVWFLDVGSPPQRMRNMLFLATGNPRMLEAGRLAGLEATGWSWSPHLVDLDQDGRLDVHVTNGMTRDFSDSDVRAGLKAEGKWDRLSLDVWMKSAPRLEPDRLFRNLGGLQFTEVGEAWGLGAAGISYGAGFGDLDGDGDPDFVVNEFDAPPRLYRNRTSDTHRFAVRLVGRGPNTAALGAVVTVESGGLRQVRDVALGAGFMSAHDTEVLFGLGGPGGSGLATRVDRVEIRWPDGTRQSLGPFDADQRLRVSAPTPQPAPPPDEPAPLFRAVRGFPSVAPGESAPAPTAPAGVPFAPDRLGPALAVSDAFPGGPPHPVQLLVAGAPGIAPQRFERTGQGFARLPPAGDETDDMERRFLDLDGLDGLAGDGTAEVVSFPPASPGGASPRVVALGDFDADGRTDAFVGGQGTPARPLDAGPARLLRNAGGRLVDVTARAGLAGAGDCVAGDAAFADLDLDGRLELLVACAWGPLRVWSFRGGRATETTAKWGLAAVTGVFAGLIAADLDGDGDVDLAVSNLGTNSGLRATPGHPATARYGPIADDGGDTLVLGVYDPIAGEVPLGTYDRLAARFPAVTARFPTWASFAAARPDDLVSPERRGAMRLARAEILAAGWLRNDAGRFVFVAFPAEAQLSPSSALLVEDFDGDGVPDLFLGQNADRLGPEFGPATGGASVLLRGTGGGEFEALPPRRSGLHVVGAVEAAVSLDADADGRPDLVLTQAGGPPLAYLNAGGSRFQSLQFRSRRGGVPAAAARVVLHTPGRPDRVLLPGSRASHRSQAGTRLTVGTGGAPWTRATIVPPGGAPFTLDLGPDSTVVEVP